MGDKDDAHQCQYHRMAGHDVGKQTDGEGEGFGEESEDFDDGHQRHGALHPHGHIGPKHLAPIFACAEQIDGKECADGKHECDGYVARHIGSTGEDGYQPHEIAEEQQEEGGEQVEG